MIFVSCVHTDVKITGDIMGVVQEQDSNKIIKGCLITIEPDFTTYTDSSGVFQFSDIKIGKYLMTAYKEGFYKWTDSVIISSDKKLIKNIYLKPVNTPIVSTDSSTHISSVSAMLYGSIISGGGIFEERGFYVGDSVNMLKKYSNDSTLSFSCRLVDLKDGTTYFYQAFAVNEKGEGKGELRKFTTTPLDLPVVTTDSASEIGYTSASIHATILSSGSGSIIENGFYYGIYPNPTEKIICNISSHQNMALHLTNLLDNTIYYYKAFARNEKGEGSGEVLSFKTTEISLPTTKTNIISGITSTTAICEGEIINDGGGIINERGICYATHSTPTISDFSVRSVEMARVFICKLTNLVPATEYYCRAYSINERGISYGNIMTFTTSNEIADKTLTGEFSISDTQKVIFSSGNLQYNASSTEWRFALHQYDIIGEQNANISSTYDGWIDLFGWGTSGWNNTQNDPFAINYQPWATNGTEINMVAHSSEIQEIDCSTLSIIGKCDTIYKWSGSSNNYNKYGYGPSLMMADGTLTGNNSNYDWGVYNAISNGGNRSGMWRTLREPEWYYILAKRPNAQYLYSMATVCGIEGLIILPDVFTMPSGCSWTYQASDFSINNFDIQQWQNMENAGAVFLPSTGERQKTEYIKISYINNHPTPIFKYWLSNITDEVSENGHRTSSSQIGGGAAAYMEIPSKVSNSLQVSSFGFRYKGCAVRLVQDK